MNGADPSPELMSLISQILERTPDLLLTPRPDSTWEEVNRICTDLTDLYGRNE